MINGYRGYGAQPGHEIIPGIAAGEYVHSFPYGISRCSSKSLRVFAFTVPSFNLTILYSIYCLINGKLMYSPPPRTERTLTSTLDMKQSSQFNCSPYPLQEKLFFLTAPKFDNLQTDQCLRNERNFVCFCKC